MANRTKNMKYVTTQYLTKRILVKAVKQGFKTAAEETMKAQGFNVVAEDGWVIKVYADGRKEYIKEIEKVQRPPVIVLR